MPDSEMPDEPVMETHETPRTIHAMRQQLPFVVRMDLYRLEAQQVKRLVENMHRQPYQQCEVSYLLERLKANAQQVSLRWRFGDHNAHELQEIRQHCADIANYAMMVNAHLRSLELETEGNNNDHE